VERWVESVKERVKLGNILPGKSYAFCSPYNPWYLVCHWFTKVQPFCREVLVRLTAREAVGRNQANLTHKPLYVPSVMNRKIF